MNARLGEAVEEGMDLLLLGVFGPGKAERLYDAFDVRGAPTTLFCTDGSVDSRLLGSKTTAAIENEMAIVRSAVSAEQYLSVTPQ